MLSHALAYVNIRMMWLPLTCVASAMQAAMMATKDAITPLKAVALSGLANCIGDFVLCHICGMGVVGAGIATIASQFLLGALLLRSTIKKNFLPKVTRSLPQVSL